MASEGMDLNQPPTQRDLRSVMGVILSVASCLIVSTNLLVAAALLKLLLKKSSQSWCFVLNLAFADILVGVAITGLATEDFNYSRTRRIADGTVSNSTRPATEGRSQCLLRMAFVMSPCIASIMSMFLISLDRYAAIKRPLHYSLLSGRATAAGCLLALWSVSLSMGFLPVMVQQLQARRAYDGFCAFFSVLYDVGIIVLHCVLFFPVLSLFIYMYLDILKIACSHQKQISRVRQASSRDADPREQHPGPQHPGPQRQPQRSGYWGHVKALRTVAVLVGCFLVLWSPFFVVCVVHILCKTCDLKHVLENYLWLLGLSNSLINPLVYAFWQREVRLQLAAMFSCVTGRSVAADGVTERCNPPPPAQTQACVSVGDIPSPSLLEPTTNSETHGVPLSPTSSL
ncbi:glucose-dependent insulinotropic receptor [Menidia menidia]